MRLALALMFQNERPWLALHLPTMAPLVDGIVSLDGGSTDDSAEVVYTLGGYVYERPFDWDFGSQANCLLAHVEELEFDAILRVDPDEIISGADIQQIRWELETSPVSLWMLHRINFIHDRLHWNSSYEPFGQWRAWHLHRGIDYHPVKVHENPRVPAGLTTGQSAATIHHFGHIKDTGERYWRGQAYWSLMNNREIPLKIDASRPWIEHFPYTGEHVIDPEQIGYRAPLEAIPMNYHLNINLEGDRAVEYGFVIDNIPDGFGLALDFGSGGVGTICQALLEKKWVVHALDVQDHAVPPRVAKITADILEYSILNYDLIVSCSSLEHVGLAGRYGVAGSDPEGDLKAMRKFYESLMPGGVLLLTLPIGVDHVHGSMHRVYSGRLNALLDRFNVLKKVYWKKTKGGWHECPESEALNTVSVSVSETDWQGSIYCIGGFVLQKVR